MTSPRAMQMLLLLTWLTAACDRTPTVVPSPTPTATSRPPTSTPHPTPPTPPTATATPGCQDRGGRIDRISYRSALLGIDVPVLVYLPPCADLEARLYPAVYLLHGKPMNETQWLDLGVLALADSRISGGSWPALVLIMPRQPEPLFSSTDGGPGSYEEELLTSLIPFIEGRFPVRQRPDARALAGISRGGVWALEIGLRHPEVFDGIAALSPALAVNYARPEFDPLRFDLRPGETPSRIFLAAGQDDWARAAAEQLSAALRRNGVEHQLQILPGGHEAAFWQFVLEPMFASLVSGW